MAEYSANEEMFPHLAELSALAFQASKLMQDRRWADADPGLDEDADWAAEADALARQLAELSHRLGDAAAG
jgi:hypothetical protein